jgi:hypothetical protein
MDGIDEERDDATGFDGCDEQVVLLAGRAEEAAARV